MAEGQKSVGVFSLSIRELEALAVFRLLTPSEQDFVVASLEKRTRGREQAARKRRREGGYVPDSPVGQSVRGRA